MLADAVKLHKRLEVLKPRRSVVEENWRQCFAHSFVERGVGFESAGVVATDATQQHSSNATAKQAELLDSTGTDSGTILAASLQDGLTPGNSRWISYEVDKASEEEKLWLEESGDTVWKNIHASNFDAVGFDCMLDLVAAGMFPMFVDEHPEGGYRFEEWPLANCYFAASTAGGPVDTCFNEFPLSVEQCVNSYGIEMVSEEVRKKYTEQQLDEVVEMVRCIYPRTGVPGKFAKNLPIASVHYETRTKKVVRESGYHENPLGVPRWSQIPGSAYARGQMSKALPDLKTLNREAENILANEELAVAGMWIAEDDGVLNPRTIKIGPRKVVVAASVDSMKALTPAAKFDAALIGIERRQHQVRRVLMADQLEPVERKPGEQPTATAVLVKVELIRQLLGPIYARLVAEYLQWLGKRTFGIAYRAGALKPAPRSMLQPGRLISVKYNGPIARAQKGADVAAMDRYEDALGQQTQFGLTDAMDVYNWDEARIHRAELLGVPKKLIPDREVIDGRRESRRNLNDAQVDKSAATEVVVERAKKAP